MCVTVADEEKLECNTRCPRPEPGGCDMVVGVDLLIQLGSITFNFEEHNLQFRKREQTYDTARDYTGGFFTNDKWETIQENH